MLVILVLIVVASVVANSAVVLLHFGEARGAVCGQTVTNSITLTRDLQCKGDGLVVGADGITVNCGGHKINLNATESLHNGIVLEGRKGVTVENCVVTNFGTGVSLLGSSGNTVQNVTAAINIYAISADSHSNGNAITANRLSFNGYGLLVAGSNNTISGNIANHEADDGFFLQATSSGNVLSSNSASSSIDWGFYDSSAGAGSLGTANSYSGNACSENTAGNSYPAGLCVPPAATSTTTSATG